MRFQTTQSSCGAAALANAIALLQYPAPLEEDVIRSAKTAWDGTSAGDIVKAARKLGYSAEKYTGKRLPETLCPYVLCVDRDEHWIAVLSIVVGGPLDPSNVRMLVIDSAHNDLCYTLQPSELEKRATGTSKKKPFSAVIIRRKP